RPRNIGRARIEQVRTKRHFHILDTLESRLESTLPNKAPRAGDVRVHIYLHALPLNLGPNGLRTGSRPDALNLKILNSNKRVRGYEVPDRGGCVLVRRLSTSAAPSECSESSRPH